MQGGGSELAQDAQEGTRAGGPPTGTGTSDPTYNLISVAYHALQGAETVEQYIRDAKESGDKELLKFLRQVHRQHIQRAEQAKKLLAQHVG
jgi:hypothetical protein